MTRTNVFTLTTVLVRVVALFYLLDTGLYLVGVLLMGFTGDWSGGQALFALGYFAAMLLLAGIWLFADLIARAALARPDGAVFDSTLEPRAWREVGFAVVGVWFAVRGLIDLVSQLFSHWQFNRAVAEYGSAPDNPQLAAATFGAAVMLVAGIVLLLGARGLSRVLQRLRGRGAHTGAAIRPEDVEQRDDAT